MAGFLTFTKEKPINRVVEVDIGEIRPNPHQPRRDFDPEGLAELADSIRQYGVLQPATVRTRGRDYELLRQLPRVLNAGVDVNRYRPVTLAELGSRIYGLPGVENYHIVSPAADVAANDTVLPVLGTVTVTEEA